MNKSVRKTAMPSLGEFPERVLSTERSPKSIDIQEHLPRTLEEAVVNAGVSYVSKKLTIEQKMFDK